MQLPAKILHGGGFKFKCFVSFPCITREKPVCSSITFCPLKDRRWPLNSLFYHYFLSHWILGRKCLFLTFKVLAFLILIIISSSNYCFWEKYLVQFAFLLDYCSGMTCSGISLNCKARDANLFFASQTCLPIEGRSWLHDFLQL